LAASAFKGESRNIASEQSRLRKRVGQIIFTRLTGEENADDAKDALADTLSPGDALLKAASDATGVEWRIHGQRGRGLSRRRVNRPLLEAFNAMWDAERRLGIGEPKQALPYMKGGAGGHSKGARR